jgi:hypothetical protein
VKPPKGVVKQKQSDIGRKNKPFSPAKIGIGPGFPDTKNYCMENG